MSTPIDVVSAAVPPLAIPSETSCPPQGTRERILRAAQNLFYQHGIRAVSVDAIAAEAETTKVTLYRLFDSKDALVAACLEDQTRRFWETWDSTVKPHDGNPRAQIEALFDLFGHLICAKAANRGCPIANTAVEVDQDHPGARIIRAHHSEIARRFRALCKEMKARQPDALGDALTLMVSGAFSARCVFENTEHLDTIGEAARALLDSATLGAPRK